MICPYCSSENKRTALSCSACWREFPWTLEIESLRDEIKARETNRFRATYTLVEEVLGAARDGKPVSLAAIRGFITALLFPRTVILVGSIAGGVLLALQTYVIWSQTKLVRQQAEAAQVDRADKLRTRLARINAIASDLNLLETHLKTLARADFQLKDISKCDESCREVSLHDALKSNEALKDRPPVGMYMLTGSIRAGREVGWQLSILRQIARWPEVGSQEPQSTVDDGRESPGERRSTSVIDAASVHCLNDQENARHVKRALSLARQLERLEALSRAGAVSHYPPGTIELLHYVNAAKTEKTVIGNQLELPGRRTVFDLAAPRMGEVVDALDAYQRIVAERLDAIQLACREALKRDSRALAEIDKLENQ